LRAAAALVLKKMLNEAADVRRRHNRPGLANRHARAHDIRLSVLPVRWRAPDQRRAQRPSPSRGAPGSAAAREWHRTSDDQRCL